MGFEPTTSCLPCTRSNHWATWPKDEKCLMVYRIKWPRSSSHRYVVAVAEFVMGVSICWLRCLLFIFTVANPEGFRVVIPVWAPKLKENMHLRQFWNNFSYLIISSTQMRLHVATHLSNTLKNVELKTLCMPVSTTVACLNISGHRLYKPFHSTGLSKLTTGYGTAFFLCVCKE